MKKILFFLFCLSLQTLWVDVLAQEGGFALRGPGGVVLAWEGAILQTSNPIGGFVGYRIYRDSAEGEPLRLNEEPLALPSDATALRQKAGERVEKWIKAARAKDAEGLLSRIQNEDPRTKLLFLYDPFFAEVAGVRYTDRTAKPQVAYTYRVVQVKADGSESVPIARFQVQAGLPPDPLKPTKVLALQQGTIPIIRWLPDKTTKAPFYHVYRSTKPDRGWIRIHPNPVIILPQAEDSEPMGVFADSTLAVGETAFYGIRAVDLAGNESEIAVSEQVRMLPLSQTALPDSIHAVSVGNTLQLRWKFRNTVQTGGLGVLRASLEHPNALRLLTPKPLPPQATAFSDPDVLGEGAYLYRILVYDEKGVAADTSAQVPAVYEATERLPAPEAVTVQPNTDQTHLVWEPVSGAIGYEVFYMASIGADPVQLSNRIPAETSSFALPATILRQGAMAGFAVYALNGSGKPGHMSDPIFFTPVLKPNLPENLELTPTLGGIQLNWQAPYKHYPNQYRILRAKTIGEWEQIGMVEAGQPLLWVDDAPKMEARYYAVVAVLGMHQSDTAVVHAPINALPGVQSLSLEVVTSAKGLVLVWGDESPKNIFRRSGNGNLVSVAETVSGGSWLDVTAQKGKRYAYVVALPENPEIRSEEVVITFR